MALAAYYGVTLTLSDTNAHCLLDLLKAVDSTLGEIIQNVGQLTLTPDSGNSSNLIYVGDSNVSSTRMAYPLAATSAPRYYEKEAMNIPVLGMYVRASGGTPKLHVEIIP